MNIRENQIFSKTLRSGNRTYFFDVKKTRAGEHYLIITESKKNMSENGGPIYRKFKIYLYKEDFSNFKKNLEEVFNYIKKNNNKINNNFKKNNINKNNINKNNINKNNINKNNINKK
ncbi:DUF3276 family protein [Candidatus Shikimatogenerans silvanidophilus]|uniref:DUF3276 family protein n=1 Tax=Candidatus Shikimatogenerans silvanidophilus TaxID=2782547 RepID=UPI001BACFB47|nr:DUF3276 family protein [Candidatus Shikimatogenerans silvanidophilus]